MENEATTELTETDWVEIQPDSTTNEARWFRNQTSLVIKESFFIDSAVFPPSNHEDLPYDSLNQEEEEEEEELLVEEQSQVFLPQPPPPPPLSSGEGGERKNAGRWITTMPSGLGFLSSAIGKIVSGISKCAVSGASIRWFASATTAVGALAVVLVLYRRAKRRQRKVQADQSKHHLMLLIQSKDQKISQLLLQVSQLNDILLARRRVPVLQVG